MTDTATAHLSAASTAAVARNAGPVLDIKNLTIGLPKGADRPYAVEKLDLTVNRGEIVCIVGESGSGKSVMTSAIMNDVPPRLTVESGEVLFDGRDVLKMSNAELNDMRGARISMIYQEPMAALNPSIRIGKQVEEVFELHRPEIDAEERRKETIKLLEQMKLPTPERIYRSYPHEVSGGQSQRVVIAMALACKPDILIADEPTTALDVTTQKEILLLINELRDVYDNATIFITHDFGVVAEIADRVAVMRYGQLVEQGSRESVLLSPQRDYTKLLVDAMPLLETARTPDLGRNDEPIVSVKGLHKVYGAGGSKQVHAVNDASFILRAGETLGVVGESGSGKSTLAKSLIRLVEPTEGAVVINGEDFLALKDKDLAAARQHIQMIFQDPFGSLNPSQKVSTIIGRSMELRGIPAAEQKAKTIELLNLVGLGEEAYDRSPRNFSGGQRQRIGIARALAMEPQVIIADESVSALDLSIQKQVLWLMNDLQERLKLAIVFITHDLRVAAQISDYITVMEKGVMVELGTADDVFNNPKHPFTKKLLDAAPGKGWHPPRLSREEAERIASDTGGSIGKSVAGTATSFSQSLDESSTSKIIKSGVKTDDVSGEESKTTPLAKSAEAPELRSAITRGASTPRTEPLKPKPKMPKAKATEKPKATTAAAAKAKTTSAKTTTKKAATKAPSKEKSASSTSAKATAKAPAKSANKSAATKTVTAKPPAKAKTTSTANASVKAATKVTGGSDATRAALASAAAKRAKGTTTAIAATKPQTAKTKTAKAASTKANATTGKAAPAKVKTAPTKTKAATTKAKTTARATAAGKAATPARAATRASAKAKAKDNAPPRMRKPRKPDELKMISGVGPKIEGILNALGIYSFEQISKWKKAERAWVDDHLRFKGRIEREDWVKQAKALAKGGRDEYVRGFGKEPL